jgi:hypothetical protein
MLSNGNSFAAADVVGEVWKTFPPVLRWLVAQDQMSR